MTTAAATSRAPRRSIEARSRRPAPPRAMSRRRRIALACVRFGLAALCFGVLGARADDAATPWRWTGVQRIVAFGDVHGADRELVALLTQVGVIDAAQHWAGGATHLVSVGDLIDRGPDSKAVLDLMMRLEEEAPRAGGYVHIVLGNHEAMNLAGDDRYASAEDAAAFADPHNAQPAADGELPGQAERAAALAPDGRYGAWLATHPALIVINGTAFVHGGLPTVVASGDLAALNTLFRAELLAAAQAPNPAAAETQSALLSDVGPLWYRGTARCHALIEAPRLHRVLDALHAQRVVIGHTPTRTGRVLTRFDGAVVMIDTGMLEAVYHGHPSALVIEGDAMRVVVAGTTAAAPPEAETGGYAGEWASVDATAAMLASAPVASADTTQTNGGRGVVLATPNGSVAARFEALPKDQLRHEIAAYRLDRLLQLGFVAPVADRVVDGKHGILYVPEPDWVSDRVRRERNLAHPNDCEVGADYALMLAFDVLIGNETRSVDNVGYDRSLTELRLRDQGDAFRPSTTLRNDANPPQRLPPAFRAKLAALDARSLAAAMQDQLDSHEIKALLARRDAILRDWPATE
ncbi:MAG TPA: metallophosphoesterase [Pseudomonadales bacterium]|nr:metallophosphoesterase [Pseudomonadales bacterium]